jgi:hypothetical protein
LAGQTTTSADATATVVIAERSLSLTKTLDMDFGTHFASAGVITTSASNYARWDGQTDPGLLCLTIGFSTPTQLTRVGGDDFVPISYGTTSAALEEGAFNPATGYDVCGASLGTGSFVVTLGLATGSESDLVSVDLTGKPAGTYAGTITLTVTVQ